MEELKDLLDIQQEHLELQCLLGIGGSGVVFKGVWRHNGNELIVAVKRLKICDTEAISEISKEIKNMKSLQFDYICKLYGGCVASQFEEVWLVMEFVGGGDLSNFLAKYDGPLPRDLQLSFFIQATTAVASLHNAPVPMLHRDIKSLNFLVKDTKLLLTDFGLSRSISAGKSTTFTLGTINWVAPEIVATSKPQWTEQADIYSLGMLFYEIVARKIPYHEDTNVGFVIKKIKTGVLPKIPADCPKEFATIIQQCWNPKQAKRPTAIELLVQLKQLSHRATMYPLSPANDIELVLELTKREECIQPAERQSPSMHYSAFAFYTPLIRDKLARGERVDTVDQNNRTPLHIAAMCGNVEGVAFLVSRGAAMGARDTDGNTVLHNASVFGQSQCIEALLAAGANIEERDPEGNTSLHKAITARRLLAAMLLVERGADTQAVNNIGDTPLHKAACVGGIGIIPVLIQNGADLNARNARGHTPTRVATLNEHAACVAALVRSKAVCEGGKHEHANSHQALRDSSGSISSDFEAAISFESSSPDSPIYETYMDVFGLTPPSPKLLDANNTHKNAKFGTSLDSSSEITIPSSPKLKAQKHKMLKKWDKGCTQKQKFRTRIYDGIPDSIRGEVWCSLTSERLHVVYPARFDKLLDTPSPYTDQISFDAENVLPTQMFCTQESPKEKREQYKKMLFNVLLAFCTYAAQYIPNIAYVAAILVMQMNEVNAFWTIISIRSTFCMDGIFTQNYLSLSEQVSIVKEMVDVFVPTIAHCITRIDTTLHEWFSTLFITTLPFAITLRIWDIFLLEGPSGLFLAAVALLKIYEKPLLKMTSQRITTFLQFTGGKNEEMPMDFNVEVLVRYMLQFRQDALFETLQKKYAILNEPLVGVTPMYM